MPLFVFFPRLTENADTLAILSAIEFRHWDLSFNHGWLACSGPFSHPRTLTAVIPMRICVGSVRIACPHRVARCADSADEQERQCPSLSSFPG